MNDVAPRKPLRSRSAIWAIALAAALVAIIFSLYEIIERTWLLGVDEYTLHVLHRVRGFGSSLIAAIFVAWFVTRTASPLQDMALTTEQWMDGHWPSERSRVLAHARWFVRLRWFAITAALVMVVIAVKAAVLPFDALWPLLGTVAVLGTLNVIYITLMHYNWGLRYALPFQAYADLAILTVLLQFSGGAENPLAVLMIFHVIIAGIVLNRGQCYGVAAFGSLLFAIMASCELAGLIAPFPLANFPNPFAAGETIDRSAIEGHYIVRIALQTLILMLTAYFVSTLTDRIRHDERQLRRLADQALSQRKLLEQAMDVTGTGVCLCTDEFKPQWINERWRAWFGGASAKALEATPSASRVKDRENETSWSVELTVPSDPNSNSNSSTTARISSRVFRITTAPMIGRNGRVDCFASLAQEFTMQKRSEQQMIRAGKLAAAGELAGHIAHEINNPVGIITAKIRLILTRRSDEISPTVARDLNMVAEQVDRVARITRGLLSTCRPSSIVRLRVDVRKTVQKVIELIEPRAVSIGVEIECLLPDHPLCVHANADEIEQVFLNLILNSLDAMPNGGRLAIHGQLQTTDDGEWVVIDVADTGPGIPPEISECVFEPFFTTKTEGKGTGLGLSICHGLVTGYGGRIDFTSHPSTGTTVVVTLPADSVWHEG